MHRLRTHKNKYLGFLFSLFLMFNAITVNVHANQDGTSIVRAGWYEDSYNITGSNGERSGYGYEYQQTVAGYTGWKYKYTKAGWSDLFEMIQEGKIDLLSGVSYTEKRAQTMLFSQLPMGHEKYCLYANLHNTNISLSDLNTLNNKRVGLLKDSVQASQFFEWEQENHIQMKYVYVNSFEEGKQKAKNHEIDCVVSTETPAWIDYGMTRIAITGGSDIYFAINKNRPDLKEELDNAMRKIQNDKPFYTDELYQKYLSTQSTPVLTNEEEEWLDQNKQIRIGYLKNDLGISEHNTETQEFSGVITDYLYYAGNNMDADNLNFMLYEYDTQEELIEALKKKKIDAIFHFSQNPYVAEENGFILSNTILSKNLAVMTSKLHFNEDVKNTVAIKKGDLYKKWFVSYNYPNWKIKEMTTESSIEKAVKEKKVDCFLIENENASIYKKDQDLYCVYLTMPENICFALNRTNTTLLSILNKTLEVVPSNMLTASRSMYESANKKVTLADFIQDNYVVVTIVVIGIFIAILILLQKSRSAEAKAKQAAEQSLKLNVQLQDKQAQLQSALIQAENANRAKTSFLNNMSHDIRTPMNAIMGFTNIALKKNSDPQINNYLNRINDSTELLLTLINDVLDISRIESGNVSLNLKIAYLPDVEDSALNVIMGLISNRNLDLKINKNTLDNGYVWVDESKLRDILVNILSNAVKYTDDGGKVQFVSKYKKLDNQHIEVVYECKDTGIGMSEEFQKHIFDEFSQEQKDARTQYKGTGLGMSITKKYVDMMKGTITLQSEKEKGTSFIIKIPLALANSSEIISSQKEENIDAVKHCRILLAEDNDLNAEIAIVQLEEVGMRVQRVKDGKEAVKTFMSHPEKYDVILMDIMMPNMDGYEATKKIRSLPIGKKVPIIALTANAFSEDIQKSADAGMDGHVSKPIVLEDLIQVIFHCLLK